MSGDECSGAFDPLGDAVNEGVVIGNAYRVRALVWDRPLTTSNQTSTRYAMIDNATARLYIRHNANVPLLVDSGKGDPPDPPESTGSMVAPEARRPPSMLLPVVDQAPAIPSSARLQTHQSAQHSSKTWSDAPIAVGICKSIGASFGSPTPDRRSTPW